MSNEKTLPQIDAEKTEAGAKRARYAAYVQRIREMEMKKRPGKADEGAEKKGGAAL